MTFAIPPGERVFLRSASDKVQECATPGKEEKTTKLDTETQPQTATTASNKETKDAQAPQEVNVASNNDGAKIDIETAHSSCSFQRYSHGSRHRSSLERSPPILKNEEAQVNTRDRVADCRSSFQ